MRMPIFSALCAATVQCHKSPRRKKYHRIASELQSNVNCAISTFSTCVWLAGWLYFKHIQFNEFQNDYLNLINIQFFHPLNSTDQTHSNGLQYNLTYYHFNRLA